jgi:replication factor C large subunit
MPDSARNQQTANDFAAANNAKNEEVRRGSDLWTSRHAPKRVDDAAGNDEARETIKKWAFDWQRGKNGKPLLLYGPTGSGKTAVVRALAAEMSWALAESNASENRGGAEFAKLAASASASDLYGSRRLLFVDEVDAVFDRASRGEGGKSLAAALAPALEQRAFPVILAAENAWEPKLAALRAYCALVEFKRVNWRSVAKTLKKIAAEENSPITQEQADETARRAGGDLRAAINDLQATLAGGTQAAREAALPGERDRQERVFETLRAIFHARSFADALRAADSSGEDLERLALWIDENIPREYDEDARERAAAFESMSKATLYQKRIMRSQNWSLLKYVRALAFAGVAAARRETKPKFVSYAFPSVLKALGETKKNRELLRAAVAKVESSLHCSKKQALETIMVFGGAPGFAAFFGLSKEEAELLSSLE